MAKANINLLAELENRIRFETLISDISARFVRLPSETVDHEIERAFKQVLEFFDVDRCGILEVNADKEFACLTHASYAEGVEPVSKEINLVELFPWTYKKLVKGQPARAERLTELPPEAEHDRLSCLATGVKSFLSIPLFCIQGIRYLLAIQSIRVEREWPEDIIPRLSLLGEIFVNALERRNTDQAFREILSRLNLATDSAGAGIWSWDYKTGLIWATEKAHMLYGFPSDEKVTFDRFMGTIHPDDRDRVSETARQAFHEGSEFRSEYRIVLPDQSVRWISARAQAFLTASGGLDRMTGVSIDITERKQREESLRLSEARVAAAIDVAGLGFYETGDDARVIFQDDRTRALLGVPLDEESRGREYWLAHIHPEDFPKVFQASMRIRGEGLDRIAIEYRYMHPSHGPLWFHHLARVLERNETGRAIRAVGVIWDITERKRAEKQQEERLQFETLLADLSAGFIASSADQVDRQIEDALRRVCELLGIELAVLWQWSVTTPGVITPTHFYGVPEGLQTSGWLQQEDYPWFVRQMLAGRIVAASSLEELPAEAAHDRESCLLAGVKSNLTLPLSVGGEPPVGALGLNTLRAERDWPDALVQRLQLVAQIFTNALARKRSEQALRESQERLSMATDSAGAGIWSWDYKTGQIWATEKAHSLYGFSLDEEVTFDQFMGKVHPDDRNRISEAAWQAFREGTVFLSQYRIVLPDQSVRWISVRAQAFLTASGGPDRMMGVSLNITKQKHLLEQVKNAAEEWQITFNTIQDLIMVLDGEFRIVRFNRATESFLGLPPEKILGSHCHTLMHPASMPFESCPAMKAMKTKQHEEAEVYFDQKNIWLLISATPIFDDQGMIAGFIHTAKDMTERKRADEELLRLREEYTHIARVSAMGELTASLAHELKQPLAAIRSNAQSALRSLTGDKPDIDELHEILQDIIIDNRRADDVIGKVRALMRKGAFHITELNMKELVQDIMPLVTSHRAMRKIALNVELDDTIPLVAGDRIQIQQVILNLILNSIEAVMNMKTESRSIRVRVHQQDARTVALSVKDNGPGVETKAMPHIFEAFYTTKPEGLGMGLAICRSIIENHGGRLWAENNPDGGATFYFTIPIAQEKSA